MGDALHALSCASGYKSAGCCGASPGPAWAGFLCALPAVNTYALRMSMALRIVQMALGANRATAIVARPGAGRRVMAGSG